ncbi:MAG: TRAP transporter small permease [Stomatobaculum sp.]
MIHQLCSASSAAIDKFLNFRESCLWKILLKIQKIVCICTCVLCCLILLIEVVCRYVLGIDFKGYDEIVLLFAIWLYFIGGSYAMYKKEHINADMLTLILKGKLLSFAHMITNWITFLITTVLFVWGVEFFIYASQRVQKTTVWRIPIWWAQCALTVGYSIMAFYALIYALEDTVLFLKKKTRDKE